MKKKEAKELLKLSDKCPNCKNGIMGIECEEQFDSEKIYFLMCSECGYDYDN